MDYGKVLSRAWQITWRWKILWILGFLTSLSGSISGTNLYGFNRADLVTWRTDLSSWPNATLWLILIGCLVLLVLVVLMVLSVVATGGLIAGVRQIEEEGTTTLRQAWRTGVRRFWTLFGISLLVILPLIVVAVAGALLLGLALFPVASSSAASGSAAPARAIASVVCGALLCCATLPVGLVLAAVVTYAQRAAILEDLRSIDALKRGWQVFRDHLGPTLLLWLLFFLVSLALGVVTGVVAFPILLALISIFEFGGPAAWSIALAVCGGLVAFVVSGFLSAIAGTFTSATWTLAFRQLTAAPPAVVEPSPEP
jgi:hypothetical protein